MIQFPSLAKIIPEGISGKVEIRHVEVTPQAADMTQLRAAIHRRMDDYVPAGVYAHLLVNGTLMMSDTPMEQRTNRQVIRQAHGHVLIAGLGLGMILHPIAAKPEVTKVTVVEMSPDVVKLVGPYLPKKVEVVEADIFEWKPVKGTKFSTIYHDIWPYVTLDNLPEMIKLHRRFGQYKTSDGWMDSWQRDTLLAQRAQQQRHRW